MCYSVSGFEWPDQMGSSSPAGRNHGCSPWRVQSSAFRIWITSSCLRTLKRRSQQDLETHWNRLRPIKHQTTDIKYHIGVNNLPPGFLGTCDEPSAYSELQLSKTGIGLHAEISKASLYVSWKHLSFTSEFFIYFVFFNNLVFLLWI